jgi:hypothetical protein
LFPKEALILDYAEFLKDIGMWTWNVKLIEVLKHSFTVAMLSYNEKAMCRLIKLIAYNHVKDQQFLKMIEDALCLRVATSIKDKKPLGLDTQAMLSLTEGMSVLSQASKPLNDLLKRVIVEQDANKDNLINLSPRLCLQVINVLDDYEVAISPKLAEILNHAVIESHVKHNRFSLEDLSYLALSRDRLTESNQQVLKEAI